ncbi:hypothetical protein KY334_03770 [Candidatus Woesearchaeota archaeon]|nr:hypothetical protein [Candidatus Woesearchaeota archaeon]
MNRKAQSSTLVKVLLAIIVLVIMMVVIGMIRDRYKAVGNFGGCETLAGTPGMCIDSIFTCKSIDGVPNPGRYVSGSCPSERTKSLIPKLSDYESGITDKHKKDFPNDISKTYTTCCVVEKCSDVSDWYFNEKDGAWFEREDCNLKEDKTCKERCLGYSEKCTEENGCCCVLNSKFKKGIK